MIDLILLGNHIRELRKKRGLTQEELAGALSVSFQAVSNWERGITPPDIENLTRIASFFGVLVDSLLSGEREELYLGIDGGGTKTEFVVVTSAGQVLDRIHSSGSNPNDVGFSKTEELIQTGTQEILTRFPTVGHIFCGVAGMATGDYASKLHATLKNLYPGINVHVGTDAQNLFGLNDEADMVVISGTGSVTFVKTEEGFQRIGGWGYLLDQAGSAYDIGRDAISHALREEDLRKPPSLITRLLRQKMNTPTVWDHVQALYRGGRSYIASFASIVFEAYRDGDPIAVQIVDRSAKALADLLNTGVEQYHARAVAVASGGLFEHYPHILMKHIRSYTSVQLITSDLPPIYGACRKACYMASHKLPDNFYENFKKTYGGLIK